MKLFVSFKSQLCSSTGISAKCPFASALSEVCILIGRHPTNGFWMVFGGSLGGSYFDTHPYINCRPR